jgi:zinc transporter ZupT
MWVNGMLGAFASGILIYAGLVEMIVEDFSRCHSSDLKHRLFMYLSVLMGYACMSIIALWA